MLHPRNTFRALSLILLSLILNDFPGHSQVNIISERLKADLISQNVNDEGITSLLSSLKDDGSWPDIDYSNRGRNSWAPGAHPRRLQMICRAYNKPSSIYFHKPEIKSAILKIIDFYISRKPVSDNWWHNAIGAPTNLGPALVLMINNDGFGIDQPKLEEYADSLLNYYSESAKKWPSATTGANKIWLLSSSIDKACIRNNEEVLRDNFRKAFEEAVIMPGKKEGIKLDGSFYQHGPQLYCGGYGMSFMSDISYFAWLAAGTEYRMSDEQMKVISDLLLDGYRWFIQHSSFDFGATGREISRPSAGSSAGLKNYVSRFVEINAPRNDELKQFVDFIGGDASFANPGNRQFWKSDFMIQHGRDFYLSARFSSKRVNGSETMNDENLKKKWLPWGSTCIMTDGTEYRGIYAVWDWARIPGVTSILKDVPAWKPGEGSYIVSKTTFAGSVTDGTYGLAAYDYSWDNVSGRKAWFFTPEAMYCLGAGISATSADPVITSVNQCFSKGTVTLKNMNRITTFEGTEFNSGDLRWIHHNNIGYVFPGGGSVTVKNTDQTGSWYDINLDNRNTPVTSKVFSAWLMHGSNPSNASYEYIVVPSKSQSEFSRWEKKNPLQRIMNSPDLQALFDRNGRVWGVAFYKSGSVLLREGLRIESDKPCLILLHSIESNGYRISVSDPTQMLESVKITISASLAGTGAINNPDRSTTLNIPFPKGDEAGKSVTLDYSVK